MASCRSSEVRNRRRFLSRNPSRACGKWTRSLRRLFPPPPKASKPEGQYSKIHKVSQEQLFANRAAGCEASPESRPHAPVLQLPSNLSTRSHPNQLDDGITAALAARLSTAAETKPPMCSSSSTRAPLAERFAISLFCSPVVEDEIHHDATYSVSSVLKHIILRLLFEVTERAIHWRGKSDQLVKILVQLEVKGVFGDSSSDLI